MMNRKFSKGKKFIFFLPVVALIATALGFIVMYLWNWILPDITHAGTLNFWQALGLLVLCRLLFGNFNKGGGGKNRFRERAMEMRTKWQSMNEEERVKFKEEFRNRCGGWGHRSKE
ncbi:hypothetical protein DHW03_09610 [Pedobacter yonginense]|uniref:DUF1682 domain-containing protein n=1 Tax=Pedobacter yonginense TaxID=651869 RepID=A0A317EPN0_9SPHI|nr:hypothetical protein [Pedobacter yonginense]PWS27823.1 hypothetical protein DHW03_09610 [Pedobacter yonginense]